jgi:hypothetical protein
MLLGLLVPEVECTMILQNIRTADATKPFWDPQISYKT